jgi:hypothetical protein
MFQQTFEDQQQMQGVNQKLHLDWWCIWGFKKFDEELIFVAREMGLKEEWV